MCKDWQQGKRACLIKSHAKNTEKCTINQLMHQEAEQTVVHLKQSWPLTFRAISYSNLDRYGHCGYDHDNLPIRHKVERERKKAAKSFGAEEEARRQWKERQGLKRIWKQ